VANAVINTQVTLPCKGSPDSDVVWYTQQYCEHFEHGMYVCSNPAEIAVGSQYQIRVSELGDRSLFINDVTKNMTGLYICKDRDTAHVHNRVLLNIFSKYIYVLFFIYII